MKKKAIKDVDLESFHSRLAAESDRAAAILGGSLLDARLENLYRIRLTSNHSLLLDHVGPLSTFASRIALAHALCWIDDNIAHDLNLIRQIRNDFAHHLDHELSFSSQSIADRCRGLRASNAHLAGYEEAAKENPNFSTRIFDGITAQFSDPRWRFQITVDAIEQILSAVSVSANNTYQGPDLLSECYDAAASVRFGISSTATISSPSKTDPPTR